MVKTRFTYQLLQVIHAVTVSLGCAFAKSPLIVSRTERRGGKRIGHFLNLALITSVVTVRYRIATYLDAPMFHLLLGAIQSRDNRPSIMMYH